MTLIPSIAKTTFLLDKLRKFALNMQTFRPF